MASNAAADDYDPYDDYSDELRALVDAGPLLLLPPSAFATYGGAPTVARANAPVQRGVKLVEQAGMAHLRLQVAQHERVGRAHGQQRAAEVAQVRDDGEGQQRGVVRAHQQRVPQLPRGNKKEGRGGEGEGERGREIGAARPKRARREGR